jgi:tRNA-dihydrouridine synthase 1
VPAKLSSQAPMPHDDSTPEIPEDQPRPSKKQKREEVKKEKKTSKQEKTMNPNLIAMQAHCFHILRPLVSRYHDVRNALAQSRAGDIDAFENVLTLTEKAVREGLVAYQTRPEDFETNDEPSTEASPADQSSDEAVRRCKRPFWICQPYVRPLPKEAIEKGSMSLSKKEKAKLAKEEELARASGLETKKTVNVALDGQVVDGEGQPDGKGLDAKTEEVPREGLVCG